MRILFFGDSIAHGVWDTQGGWVQRLRSEYDKHSMKDLDDSYPDLYNLSIDGEVLSGVLKRLPYEIEARRYLGEPFILVFAIGINDTIFRGKEVATTAEQYREDLNVMLESAKHYSDKILFVGLTPVDDKLCNPWIHSSSGKCFSNVRILKFEETLRKFCLKKGIPCVQIFEKFNAAQDKEPLLADGLHPNAAGHELIAELVKPELDKLLQKT